jgi:hypothetical protein
MFCVAMFGILWAKRYSEGEGMKRQNDPLLPGCWAASEAGGYPELKPSATRGERLGWLAAMCGRLIKCYEAVNNSAASAGYRLAVRALSRKADENDQAISDDCYAMLGRMRRLAADVYALACEMLPDGGDFGAAGAIRERAFADVKRAWATIQHAARVKAALPDAPAGATPPTPQADARRYWTAATCPECGAPGLEYPTQADFRRRHADPKPGKNTIKRRIDRGEYLARRDGRLPWCLNCRERTPLGAGAVARPDAPPANDYELTPGDLKNCEAWARAITAKITNLHGFDPQVDGERRFIVHGVEIEGGELYAMIYVAVADKVKATRGEATRDECEAAALEAVKKHNADIRKAAAAVRCSGQLEGLDEHGRPPVSGRRSKAQRHAPDAD